MSKKVVGYHIARNGGDLVVSNSDNQEITARIGDSQKAVIEFLLEEKGDAIKVFYHMGYSVACLMWFLEMTKEEGNRLVNSGSFDLPPYLINHIPHKQFSIKTRIRDSHGDRAFSNFSDMSQFAPWDLNTGGMYDYAHIAQSKGEIFYKALRGIGLNPTSLTSPIRAFEKEILENCDLPTHDDLPDGLAWSAYQCCHGGWLEVFRKGHYQAWDYDITSAYPYYVSQLIDHRYGEWVRSSQYDYYNNTTSGLAIYGIAYCKVNIWSWFSPIIYNVDNLESYTPVGEWETWLTKGEIDFIREYQIGTVEVIDGWWWLPDMELGKVYRPLKHYIHQLYARKNQTEGLEKEVVKRIMTGMWGKLLGTTKKGFSSIYNPVWASWVESEARLAVARFVLDNDLTARILSIAVDGVLSSHPVTALDGEGLGSWKLTAECPALVVSSGVVAVEDKEAVSEFSMNYHDLLGKIHDNPGAGMYHQTKLSPVTVQKAVRGGMFDKLGQLIEITKTIDIGYEQKRLYEKIPKTGGQLLKNKYESQPIDISFIMKDEIIINE